MRLKKKPPSALQVLANEFHRMGEDANHVRLTHLKDAKIREPYAAAANAYYNAERKVRRLIKANTSAQRAGE
jgi:hypothetical protein